MVKSPIKIIDSGSIPTTENLGAGQIAFGAVDGETKLYGSDGTTVTDLTASGEQGPQGPAGEDGITPTIGDNGNWFLGDTDTGKPSRGEQGPQGDPAAAPKKASYTGNLTYSNKVHCERYGDVVCVTMNSSDGAKLPKSGTSAGRLPVGYRPITAVSTICRYGANPTAMTDVYADNVGFLTVNTDGTVSWGFSTEPPDVQRWTWSISYVTNDSFPD